MNWKILIPILLPLTSFIPAVLIIAVAILIAKKLGGETEQATT